MFTTIQRSNTEITKLIILNKVHQYDDLYSIEPIPFKVSVELTATPGEPKPEAEEINVQHSINFHKVTFFLESILNESFVVTPAFSDKLLKLFADFDNGLILSPDGGEASLGVMLHAKVNTITECCSVGAIKIVDTRTDTCYTYYDEDNEYDVLPSIKELVNNIPFHEQPWWFRNDISTYDGSAINEEEYNRYLEEHFEKVQQAMKEPFLELDSKLRSAILGDQKSTGDVIDLDEFKKKTWKPKLI